MILPQRRDPRFTTVRRGGTLSDEDHRALALWAAACAESVVARFVSGDDRPLLALETCRLWAQGRATMTEARTAGHHANAAARPWRGTARFAAYSAAQAVLTAHVPAHYLGAAAYALKAAGEDATAEWFRQRSWLPAHLADLVLEDQQLRNSICWSVFPAAELKVADCSSSPGSRTYRVERASDRRFLKFGPPELLVREAALSRWFGGFGLAPEVLSSEAEHRGGLLATRALAGTSGIAPEHLAQPRRLARVFGEALAAVHRLPPTGCPAPDRLGAMLAAAEANFRAGVLADYLAPEGPDAARRHFVDLQSLAQGDAVIHGDYCLPNILLEDFRLVGFVDLGNGGWGDSHHDLFWGLWTLEHNLKSTAYHGDFLDAYGRGRVETDRLEFNRLLSAFLD